MTLFDLEQDGPDDGVTRVAVLSDDTDGPDGRGAYRYVLGRRWAPDGPVATFVMLNPSTADARIDDQTVRRGMWFSRSWGCAAMHFLNLHAFRATDPKVMWAAQGRGVDIVGPENDRYLRSHIMAACTSAMPLIAAWGSTSAPGTRFRANQARIEHVLAMPGAVAFQCLGKTASGAPRHPSRLPNTAQLERYP